MDAFVVCFQISFLISVRWPAMVEADPDEECYFEMGQSNSIVPVSSLSK